MKIGMVLDNRFPPDPRVENEATSLIKEGHTIYLYCLDFKGDLPLQEKINGIHVHRVRVPKILYSISALAYTLPIYHLYLKRSIISFAKKYEIEALHVHDIQVARSCFWANRSLKLPLVLDLHENRPEIMKYYGHVKSTLGKLLINPKSWQKAEYKYIKKADRVITVTQEAVDHYRRELDMQEDKFVVVPNTVRKAFYTDYLTEKSILQRFADNFTLLYLGDTGLRRGLLTAIEAMPSLIPDIPNIKLVIVGKSKEDHVMISRIKELGLENHVSIEGWQNFKLFQSYIQAADLGICLIHRNIHHDTTYANKVFQYMSFGKPIIVTDCTSQRNLIVNHQCGLVIGEKDTKAYADSVRKMYGDKSFYNECSSNAKQAVEQKLNWETINKGLIQLYDQLQS